MKARTQTHGRPQTPTQTAIKYSVRRSIELATEHWSKGSDLELLEAHPTLDNLDELGSQLRHRQSKPLEYRQGVREARAREHFECGVLECECESDTCIQRNLVVMVVPVVGAGVVLGAGAGAAC